VQNDIRKQKVVWILKHREHDRVAAGNAPNVAEGGAWPSPWVGGSLQATSSRFRGSLGATSWAGGVRATFFKKIYIYF
jgi:hypothetical protein